MLKLKSKWAKRMLAFVLSGAMIVTSMTSSTLTANATEDTGEEYSYEVEETQEAGNLKDEEGNEVIAEATKEDEETVETTVVDEDNQVADDQDDSASNDS